jgi:phosphoglucan,water dikinase
MRRIRIGNQTAFSASFVMEPFEYAVANGFDCFEWFPDKRDGAGWTEEDISSEMRARIRSTAHARDISLSVHARWRANPLLAEAAGALREAVEFAEDIGASVLNIHLFTDEGIGPYVEAVTPLAERLARAGIRLSIENTPYTGPEDFNELFRLVRRTGLRWADHLGMCLDIGHANIFGETRNEYLRFIDMLDMEVPIVHLHMHENFGDSDAHMTLFTGPSREDPSGIKGVIDRMRGRGFSGCVIFEQWPRPEWLLNEARQRLLGMIDGLQESPPVRGGEDFLEDIVMADRRSPSWREKLRWVHDLLAYGAADPGPEELVHIAIYLRLIGSGAVPCREDGGHHRPSHHAGLSERIYARLSGMTDPENAFIIRRIYPWLPSFDSPFTRPDPLRRIRDIAHRNDIPGELKREIKTTLQNKLHRSAGPEDLATSTALLERITRAEADYPPDFIREFRRFHEELKEFFNASTVDEQFNKLLESGVLGEPSAIRDFLRAKAGADNPERALGALELLTALRRRLKERLSGEQAGPEGQRLQIADIGLEDVSFVLLSRVANRLEEANGREVPWPLALGALCAAVDNLSLGGLDAGECEAIGSELRAWSQGFDHRDHGQLLRLRATLQRCRRLSDAFCLKILSLFPERAERLGRALGVADHAIGFLSEAEIRRHPVFQVSRLLEILLINIRTLMSLPPWSAVVVGKASGRLVSARGPEDLSPPNGEPVVALLERIRGEEEMPAGVAGIVIAHETPCLSHLAIRARQGNVAFAACEDGERFSELKGLCGKRVVLDVSEEWVTLKAAGDGADGGGMSQHIGQAPVPDLTTHDLGGNVVPLSSVSLATGGCKAEASRRLEEFSRLSGAEFFKTPPSLVIPFGTMQESIRGEPAVEEEYRALTAEMEGLSEERFNDTIERLVEITGRLQVPGEVLSAVAERFGPVNRLMVRSSSNCEDLAGFAGAGFFESVANVAPDEVAHAVRRVWASLWGRRAAAGRRSGGIPQGSAHMAVIVQQMLVPDYSFLIHTMNPLNNDPGEICVELAVGLGETLASGDVPGAPYRMIFGKRDESVRTLAFASLSHALWPGPTGGLIRRTVDYSGVRLSTDGIFRERLGARLGAVGRFVEEAFGRPQDIEGLLLGDSIYLVQSRPEQTGS